MCVQRVYIKSLEEEDAGVTSMSSKSLKMITVVMKSETVKDLTDRRLPPCVHLDP